MIWCEILNHIKCLEREWTDDVPLSSRMGKKDNDREISEWYNEVKLGPQIRICKGGFYNEKNCIRYCDIALCYCICALFIRTGAIHFRNWSCRIDFFDHRIYGA